MPRTVGLLLLLLALAAPAPLAAGERLMLAQAQATEEEPPTTPNEEDAAAQPDEETTEPPDGAEAQPPDEETTEPPDGAEAQPPDEETPEPPDGAEAQPPDEGRPAEEAQSADEAETDDGARPDEAAEPLGEAQEEAETAREAEPAEDAGILRTTAAVPGPVRETWQALIQAARSGHIDRLGPIMQAQPVPPMVAFDEVGDPIAYLKSLSGDPEGREILAILLEVLEAGFLHVDEGTPQEMYLWPYFARHPVEELTPPQMVELFTLLTAGDYQDMLSYGAYIFFRVGIAPDGRWLFFLAGD